MENVGIAVKYILIYGGKQKEIENIKVKDIDDEDIKEIQIDCYPLGLLGEKEYFDDEAMLKIDEIKKNAVTCACVVGNCSDCKCKELEKMCNLSCHKGKENNNCSRKRVSEDSEDSEAKRPKLGNQPGTSSSLQGN